jgi:hypothetical protein
MPVTSIDELLLGGGNATQPETPENQYLDEPDDIKDVEPEDDEPDEHVADLPEDDDALDDEEDDSSAKDYDEYGNEKPKPRMYTEAEHKEILNKVIRDRVERFDRNNPSTSPQVTNQQIQQQTKGFEYNPDSEQSLPQQLESFIEQTVTKMTSKRDDEARALKEREIQDEFQEKLVSGMQRFNDFRDVVGQYEITNPMTLATRSMSDPAAFLYAAAKRHPQELERIAKMRDPYAQMTEMGRLEERMRRNKPTTKAPRPIGRTQDDGGMPAPKKKKQDETIEDLIAKADNKKLNRIKGRQGGRR